MSILAKAVGGLFPDGVGVAVMAIGAAPDAWPDEARAMANAVPHRRREFAAGRAAARAAMTAAGLMPAAIPMAADRAPVWPAGVVGSITHAADVALAVAAPQAVAQGLGLDMEPDAPLPGDVLSEICDGDECAWIAGQVQPLRWARVIFVAKEAAFKCQYPASATIFGFDGMSVQVDTAHNALVARFTRAIPPFAKGDAVQGRFALTGGQIVAGFCRPGARAVN